MGISTRWQHRPFAASKRIFSLNNSVAVLGVHLVLALVATYPLVREFSTYVIGGGDSAQNAWNFWWVNWAVQRGDIYPFYTQMIYYPTGASLAYHTLGIVNGWLGALLQSGLGLSLIQTYNTVILFTFVGTGFATYLLVRSLTTSSTAAMVASVIFTFAPIRMSRVFYGNLNLFSTQLIPLAVLSAVQMLRTGRWYYALFTALMIGVTAGLDLFLAYGTGLFVLILVLYRLGALALRKEYQQLRTVLYNTLLLGTLTLLFSAPFVWPLIQNYQTFQREANQVQASIFNSADLLGYWLPDVPMQPWIYRNLPFLHPISQEVHAAFYGNLAEKTVFIGYSVLLLLVLAWQTSIRHRLWPWLLAAGSFFLLSLGPTLHVGGQAIVRHLPYEWLTFIPLLNFGRTPSRFALFMMLALAVVCGYAVTALAAKGRYVRWLTLLIAGLIFAEFLIIPIRVDTRFQEIPAVYTALSALDANDDGSILDVPIDLIGAQGPAAEYMLYQTHHEQPIISGYISRTPTNALWLLERPFLKELRARLYADAELYAFDEHELAAAMDDLRRVDARFVVLHRWALPPDASELLLETLTALLSHPVYEDERVVAWQVDQSRVE